MTRTIEVTQPLSRAHKVKVGIGALALAGVVVSGGVVIAHEIANSGDNAPAPGLERVIGDPANIPKGHRVELPSDQGNGADAIADKYAADGQYDNLKAEIMNEYKDGKLPVGYLAVYDKFVDRNQLPELKHDN